MKNENTRANFTVPLPWLVSRATGNGATGHPFPTIPDAAATPQQLPELEPVGLPHAEEPPASPPRGRRETGRKGGEEEC